MYLVRKLCCSSQAPPPPPLPPPPADYLVRLALNQIRISQPEKCKPILLHGEIGAKICFWDAFNQTHHSCVIMGTLAGRCKILTHSACTHRLVQALGFEGILRILKNESHNFILLKYPTLKESLEGLKRLEPEKIKKWKVQEITIYKLVIWEKVRKQCFQIELELQKNKLKTIWVEHNKLEKLKQALNPFGDLKNAMHTILLGNSNFTLLDFRTLKGSLEVLKMSEPEKIKKGRVKEFTTYSLAIWEKIGRQCFNIKLLFQENNLKKIGVANNKLEAFKQTLNPFGDLQNALQTIILGNSDFELFNLARKKPRFD